MRGTDNNLRPRSSEWSLLGSCQPTPNRQWAGGLFLLWLGLTLLMIPSPYTPVMACGWAGDGELKFTTEVDASLGPGKTYWQRSDPPETLVRQADRLRMRGSVGYAGAARLYRQAALMGLGEAQNNLALMYEKGLGVSIDLATANHWYRQAAEQGHVTAQHSIGIALLEGRGIDRNRAQGLEWIMKSAKGGHLAAQADMKRFR